MVFVKDEVGRYLMMNQAAADFVGRNRGEVAGLSDFDLFPAEMAARVHQGDLNALASPQVQEEEVLHRTVGGPRYLLTHKRSVQIGDSRYLISSSSDITERRQTVNLLAAEKHEGRPGQDLLRHGGNLPGRQEQPPSGNFPQKGHRSAAPFRAGG